MITLPVCADDKLHKFMRYIQRQLGTDIAVQAVRQGARAESAPVFSVSWHGHVFAKAMPGDVWRSTSPPRPRAWLRTFCDEAVEAFARRVGGGRTPDAAG